MSVPMKFTKLKITLSVFALLCAASSGFAATKDEYGEVVCDYQTAWHRERDFNGHAFLRTQMMPLKPPLVGQ